MMHIASTNARARLFVILASALLCWSVVNAFPDPHPDDAEDDGWGSHGRDLTNNRRAKSAHLDPTTVEFLEEDWSFETDVSPHLRPVVPPDELPVAKRTVYRDNAGGVRRVDEHPETHAAWLDRRARRDHVDDFADVTGSQEGSVSVPPCWHGNKMFFPAYDGNLYAIDADSGTLGWKKYVPDYFPELPDTYMSRTTPVFWSADGSIGNSNARGNDYWTSAEDDDYIIIGNVLSGGPAFDLAFSQPAAAGAYILKINARNGALVSKLRVDDHPLAMITASGSRSGNWFFTGVSSLESLVPVSAQYPCCDFVGSFVSVDLFPNGDKHGLALRWKDDTIAPDRVAEGFAGVASFGSSPPVDVEDLCDDECDGAVYYGTGNLYTVPQAASDCLATHGHYSAECDAQFPGVWSDTVHKLNARTGAPVWRRKLGVWGLDPWNAACLLENGGTAHPNCNFTFGPDHDFGVAPMLTEIGNTQRRVIIAGQKSGQVWALDREDAEIVWERPVILGGILGGVNWGMCTDGRYTYVPIFNDGGGNTGNDGFAGTTGDPLPFGLNFPDYEIALGGGWAKIDNDNGKLMAVRPVPHALFDRTPPNYEGYRHVELCECTVSDDDDDGGDDWGAPDDDDFGGVGTDCVCEKSRLTTDVGLGPATPGWPSCVDGLIFAGSGAVDGGFYAMDTRDLSIVWQTSTGGSIYGGPSIVHDSVVIGSGYRSVFGYSENNKIFKFSLADDRPRPLRAEK